MARFELQNLDNGQAGGSAETDIIFEMGMMYASGRDCEVDLVSAHKWFNIAAIKGCDRAARRRSELLRHMSKGQIASALHEAREWLKSH
ncbi:sel1 repeat family protein [Phyllobacterium sp. 21LDTY02-6]|uniref:sel1 repeat family protein n=1 Tax=unclassified Phyllobacterium TaxID=2638441 RepID=UPI002020FA06|nr:MULTISPECIES: sel1 repeat family protein [unclassified Phyllobacterium]MCO4319853.1 sel1 repeat family protein [Phyllobacterium sp. 21LDTY02-6]MCX8280595.1 sel1 repeat family protein [Phyllobacterium sp. 0TCS1.6C]MCX8296440.1 sel1 repeat family protein [Phyllobacterium sp. 0TCS1.6A]